MGLFSMCMGSSSTIVPTAEGPKTVHERHAAMAAAPSSAATHADNLVALLTHAQQIELQQAFKQFDQNGNGTMCAASRCHCRSAGCPRTHKSGCSHSESRILHAFLLCRGPVESCAHSDASELKHVMSQLGCPMTDEQVRGISAATHA